MIPLNRPHTFIGLESDYIQRSFSGYHVNYLVTAGDALNLIYKHLFDERGALRVGVSPLACFHAHYPIVLAGHTPIFLDIDKDTFNLDVSHIEEWPEMDVLEIIHLAGNPNDMTTITEWAEKHNVIVVEDCAQALGAKWDGRLLGTFGDYAVFSLIKNIYVSGALMLSKCVIDVDVCKEVSKWAMRYKRLRWGIEARTTADRYNPYNLMLPLLMQLREKRRGFISSMRTIGDKQQKLINKAIGSIDQLNECRRKLADAYMKSVPWKWQSELEGAESSRNRMLAYLPNKEASKVISLLREAGLAANNLTQNYFIGYQPHIRENELLNKYYHKESCQNYEKMFPHFVAVPFSPNLTEKETNYVIEILKQI